MKNLFLVLCLSSATILSAQSTKEMTTEPETKQEQVTFQNADDIAKTLDIGQAEAEMVWNKYTEYNRAKEGMTEKNRNQMQSIRNTGEKKTDSDFETAYRARLHAQREKINLDENYYNQFLEILPASKVHTLLMVDKKDQREMRQQKGQPEQQRTRIRR